MNGSSLNQVNFGAASSCGRPAKCLASVSCFALKTLTP